MTAELPPSPETPIMVQEGHLRVAPLQEIPHLLRLGGVDPAGFLGAAGVAPDIFDHPEHNIPVEVVGELVPRLVAELNCPHAGRLICRNTGLALTIVPATCVG
jgi:hypothetical protein